MASEEEMVQLSLNHQGKDILITAPYSTALLLLNDADAASQFISNLTKVSLNEDTEEREGEATDGGGNCSYTDTGIDTDENCHKSNKEVGVLWKSKGKQTDSDHEGTLLLLQLRAKYANKLDDKKTHNSAIWQLIAKEITDAGFNLGTKNPAEKCRQKFANLQNKMYYPHLKHMKRTGEEKKETPLYFKELHDILGSKHKASPPHLQDTLTVDDSSCESEPSTSEERNKIKNRFARTVKTCKPVGFNASFIDIIKEDRTKTDNGIKCSIS